MSDAATRTQLRQRFIEAAWRLGCEGGYDALKMRSVAHAAGSSAALIYAYFADKASLMEELRVLGAEHLERALDERARSSTKAELPMTLSRVYLQHMRTYAWLYDGELPSAVPRLHAVDAAPFIERAGRLFDPRLGREVCDTLARHLWIGVHGLVSLHPTDELDDHTLTDAHLRHLFAALRRYRVASGPSLCEA